VDRLTISHKHIYLISKAFKYFLDNINSIQIGIISNFPSCYYQKMLSGITAQFQACVKISKPENISDKIHIKLHT